MEREKPRPEPAQAPERDDVHVVANRCPFCHDDVRPTDETSVACASCLARHHDACWTEARGCGACRSEARLRREAATPPRPARSRAPALGHVAWVLAGLALVAGAVALEASRCAQEARRRDEAARPAAPAARGAPGAQATREHVALVERLFDQAEDLAWRARREPATEEQLMATLAADQAALTRDERPAAVQAMVAAERGLFRQDAGYGHARTTGEALRALGRHRTRAAVPLLVRALHARGDVEPWTFCVAIHRTLATLTGWDLDVQSADGQRGVALVLAQRWLREREGLDLDLARMPAERLARVLEALLDQPLREQPWMELPVDAALACKALPTLGHERAVRGYGPEDLHDCMVPALLDEAVGPRRWQALELLIVLRRDGRARALDVGQDAGRSPEQRLAAALARWRAGEPLLADVVLEAARAPGRKADRLVALAALAHLDDPAALPALRELLEGPNAALSEAATSVLISMRTDAALDLLIARLDADPRGPHADPIVDALASHPTRAAKEALARNVEALLQPPLDRHRLMEVLRSFLEVAGVELNPGNKLIVEWVDQQARAALERWRAQAR